MERLNVRTRLGVRTGRDGRPKVGCNGEGKRKVVS